MTKIQMRVIAAAFLGGVVVNSLRLVVDGIQTPHPFTLIVGVIVGGVSLWQIRAHVIESGSPRHPGGGLGVGGEREARESTPSSPTMED